MPLELYAHYMPPCLNWLQTIWAMLGKTLYKCYVLRLFVVSGGATARPPQSAGWACQWILKENFLCIKENTIIFKKYFYTMKIVRTLKSFQLRHCLLAANSWVPKYPLGTTSDGNLRGYIWTTRDQFCHMVFPSPPMVWRLISTNFLRTCRALENLEVQHT